MTTRTMTALEHNLLAALWRLAWGYWLLPYRDGLAVQEWKCRICDASAFLKTQVQHAPGCALFGLDPALLAGLDEFDRVTP